MASSGQKAVCTLAITGAIADGTILNFRWNGITRAVVAKTAPAAPNEFAAGGNSVDYVNALADWFSRNFPFQQDFVVTRGVDIGPLRTIQFTAKKAGAAYNITPFGGSFALVGGSTLPYQLTVATKGADPVVRSQYSVYAELHMQGIGENAPYELIFPTFIDIDDKGQGIWDVGDLLHARLEDDLPVWNFPTTTYCAKSARNYLIKYAEAYGNPRQVGALATDTTRRIYRGGADYVHRAGAGFDLLPVTQTNSGGILQYRALRLGSAHRYVRVDEPQYLTFVNSTGVAAAAVSLSVTLIFSDKTELTAVTPYDPVIFPIGGKWCFAVGVTQLKLLDKVPAGKTLVEYLVQLVAPTDISPIYRFTLNVQHEPYTRYFAYINSLGALETLATYGKGSRELSLFSESADRYLPAGYDVSGGQFVQYDLQVQQQTEVTTGFRRAAELRGWTDFYRSPLKFHLRYAQALPIGVISKSIKQGKDGDTLFAHAFQYQYLYRDDFYTVSVEEEAAQGDAYPPQNFSAASGGTISIQPVTVVPSVDKTVPDVVRTLTVDKVLSFSVASAKVDQLAARNLLDEPTGRLLFRPFDQAIDFIKDIANRPNNRDGYGLSDVLTQKETQQQILDLVPLRVALKSWTDQIEP
ncbi:hypothetical protein [Spirosoma rhododendri]|uniref:Uncharacterized protein n=1 Tax=Spirosoma rhododendri TaxID=2728024 RepID=A0A7L5DM52_9BACT|nr:hypothetical protein [Spirosoma rhododendri]QJD79554.1 hypothetical protein HH216_14880 [Spirosoma rhododendri]